MKQYIAIDLKSFYASVECVDRGLDPLKTNLVVADKSRTDKTICLAVSPPLKAYGIAGRSRLFEVVQKTGEINCLRKGRIRGNFEGKSFDDDELKLNPKLELDYIVAPPRMGHYIEVSSKIFSIYLDYIAPEDMHVYSVDEVFIDATNYLASCNLTAKQLASKMILDVLRKTGITATAGVGTNLYLCKVAMDIEAKHTKPDRDGVRIAYLDERAYRERLWSHKPITDFWRIGAGYAKKLAKYGMFTMGDVAMCSFESSGLLYKIFGVNAELLIDHAWGEESCTIEDIKSYRPSSQSLSSGQVLPRAYHFEEAELIVREMSELLALDLVDKGLVCDQVVLTVGYDIENLRGKASFKGEITVDCYGRKTPKKAHGSENLGCFTSSTKLFVDAVVRLFDRIVNPELSVRRMYVVANHITSESDLKKSIRGEQLDLFSLCDSEKKAEEERFLIRERSIQKTVLSLHKRFGKNSVLKGMNLKKGATSIERNRQIGGHRA